MKNKIFLVIATFVGIIVLFLISSIYLLEQSTITSLSSEEIKLEEKIKVDYLNEYIIKHENHIMAISQNSDILNFIENKNNLQTVKNLFITLAKSNKEIFQYRYIDQTGQEIIRVDNYDKTILVENSNLQNKKNRYYFQDSMKLNKGEIYYSNIDLNKEFGKIQKPIVPTLRIATPIYINGLNKGIIILNINLSEFLSHLEKSTSLYVNLIYADGNIIITTNKKYNWSKDYNLNTKIFALYDFLPDDFEKHNSLKTDKYFLKNTNLDTNDKIFLLLIPKKLEKYSMLYQQLENIIYLFIAITLFGLPLGYFISKYISDITKDKQIYEKTKTDNVLINSVINSTDDLIFYKDSDFKYIGCNHSFEKFTGLEYNNIIGKTDFELFDEKTAGHFRKMDQEVLKNKGTQTNDEWVIYPDGQKVFLHTQKTPFSYDDTPAKGILGFSRNITKLHNALDMIKAQSYIDELTQIFNRKAYNEKIEEKLNLHKRYNAAFCIVMYDIDNFKYVNDTYGHDIGDQVLKSLSNEIKKTIRKTDLLFRIGGEEFIIIYPKTDIQKGYIATKKVLESTKNITLLKDQAITISIGLTQVQDEDTVDTIFKRVDNYLYTSKNSGKNMITTDDVVKI